MANSNENVILFESALCSPHTEIALESSLRLTGSDNLIDFVPLYQTCTRIETHIGLSDEENLRRCNLFDTNLDKLNLPMLNKISVSKSQPTSLPNITDETLEDLSIGSFPIGKYIRCNLCHLLKVSELNLGDKLIRDLASLYYLIGYESFYSSTEALSKSDADLAIISNGRFMTQAASKHACIAKGLNYMLHERGPNNYSYILEKNIHLYEPLESQVKLFTSKIEKLKLRIVGSQYFEGIKLKRKNSWKQHNLLQETNNLPNIKGLSDSIVFFVSSDFECGVFPGNKMDTGLGDQREAFSKLSTATKILSKTLVVRMHPNMSNTDPKITNWWIAQNSGNCHIIPPDSKVDSLALASECKIVVTYNSNLGIEANYRSKPVICLGRSKYYYFNEIMKPTSFNELLMYLKNPKTRNQTMMPWHTAFTK